MAEFVARFKREILELLEQGFREELETLNEINMCANGGKGAYPLMTEAFMTEKARSLAETELEDVEFIALIDPCWTEMGQFHLEGDYFREALHVSGFYDDFLVYDEDEVEEAE